MILPLLNVGDIWETPCRNYVCWTSRKLWGKVLQAQTLRKFQYQHLILFLHWNLMYYFWIGWCRLNFDDLHKTGIYSWDYFYHLGSNRFTLMRNYIKTLKKYGLSRDPRGRKWCRLQFNYPELVWDVITQNNMILW